MSYDAFVRSDATPELTFLVVRKAAGIPAEWPWTRHDYNDGSWHLHHQGGCPTADAAVHLHVGYEDIEGGWDVSIVRDASPDGPEVVHRIVSTALLELTFRGYRALWADPQRGDGWTDRPPELSREEAP